MGFGPLGVKEAVEQANKLKEKNKVVTGDLSQPEVKDGTLKITVIGNRDEGSTSGTDNTSGGTYDTSGNNNDFAASNFAAHDYSTNSPTNNIAVMQNYTTSYQQTLDEGNRQHTTGGTNQGYPVMSTLKMSKGKYYAEFPDLVGNIA